MAKKKLEASNPQQHKVISIQWDAPFFFERAVHSLDRFHYDKALKYFRRAVEYEPDNPVNHCNLAGVLSEMSDYKQSNEVLQGIIDSVDPTMTECYFYMANNYANMEDYESAEEAIIHYLEKDSDGQYLEESEELMEFLSFEMERPARSVVIKSREGLFEHDKARSLLEEGRFAEAVRILQKLVKRLPDFMAARNNLALAYYYMGRFDKAMETIGQVIELDHGNMHAMCNLAIFYQHRGAKEELSEVLAILRKTFPFHQDHVFKQATTMGILGEHETAYRLFKRLLKESGLEVDPCLFHYAAVAAYNIGRFKEAEKLWLIAERLDPHSDIPRFYLSQLKLAAHSPALQSAAKVKPKISYHYHLPFEEQFRLLERANEGIPEHMQRDPLVRSSFFWALRHGDIATKLQVIQAFGMIADSEVEEALREFLLEPNEDDYLKKVASFVLRSMGASGPMQAVLTGETTVIHSAPYTPNLPVWETEWQQVLVLALTQMNKRYDMIQQHDLETLWVEYLTRVYPSAPKLGKIAGWAAALEYLTAKMHRRAISYDEVCERYAASPATVSKNVKLIDQACKLKEKMEAIFPKFANIVKQGNDI